MTNLTDGAIGTFRLGVRQERCQEKDWGQQFGSPHNACDLAGKEMNPRSIYNSTCGSLRRETKWTAGVNMWAVNKKILNNTSCIKKLIRLKANKTNCTVVTTDFWQLLSAVQITHLQLTHEYTMGNLRTKAIWWGKKKHIYKRILVISMRSNTHHDIQNCQQKCCF